MADNREVQPANDPASCIPCDVIVIGAGMAGKAASIQLARAGLKVTCISPAPDVRETVGESLDWSAPELLKRLGLPMERLVETEMATWKRSVTLQMRDGCSEKYIPSEWLGRHPFNIELRTLHIDRLQVDEELRKIAESAGVRFVSDKAVALVTERKRVTGVDTIGGMRYPAAWFIDASGMGSSLFSRAFDLPKVEYGPPKVAIWSYFPVVDPVQGTTIYIDPSPSKYLEWVWEIPVNPRTVSVGFLTTGEAMKERREQDPALKDVYSHQLAKFPRFEALLAADPISDLSVTSFRCRAHTRVAGENWLMCGEAASMVDPITSNGVTAALRHAAEASSLILKYARRGRLPCAARLCYSSRVLQTAKFFNEGIEKIVYETPVRNRIGPQRAGEVYTGPAWSMNVVYARLKPFGVFSTALLNLMLGAFRMAAWAFYQFSRRRATAA